MKRFLKIMRWGGLITLVLVLIGGITLAATYMYVKPSLPSIESLKDVKLKIPLRVYARDGALIAEFGEERRSPIRYDSVPDLMIKAFLAAEDDRFFDHPGVDYQGLLRAAWNLLKTGEKGQGGSTITMQVARNFFLTKEKTYLRKINEIFLALKIERELSKADILELYLNVIYLGHRAYGVQAASQVYYGKNVHELELAQIAMIAGLPKAPSRYNPIADPDRAIIRRDYVLGRMLQLNYISEQGYELAKAGGVSAIVHGVSVEAEASYVAEMVRAEMAERYGNDIYSQGYRVYASIDSQAQMAANRALRKALMDYDIRHGYRGAESNHQALLEQPPLKWDEFLLQTPTIGELRPALVTEVEAQQVKAYLGANEEVTIPWEGLQWAREYYNENARGAEPKTAAEIVKVGDLIRVYATEDGKVSLSQVPDVAGALVSISPKDGAILALVGGFDYFYSKFNRAVQAHRQPGSSMKPFIYSAALEKGFTPASIINDAPVVFNDPALESAWRPENYSGKFYGPTRFREALVHSRNLVSIRILAEMGIPFAVRHLKHFGIRNDMVQRDLSMALGSGSFTPLELASSFAVIANGGYRVEPYFILRIENDDGEVLYQADPAVACETNCEEVLDETPPENQQAVIEEPKTIDQNTVADTVTQEQADLIPRKAERTLSAQNAYLIHSMMRDVIKRGTGRKALRLGRNDLAGKTGTTNDQRDAWFTGFNSEIVATAWVGFDQVKPLGNRETGGNAALPMWMDFMQVALKDIPEQPLHQPSGMVTMRIDSETGLLANSYTRNAIFETFVEDNIPEKSLNLAPETIDGTVSPGGSQPETIF